MKHLFSAFFLLLFLGCSHQKPIPEEKVRRPDTLIPREQMIRVITDIHLAEAAIASLKNKGLQTQYLTEDYFNAVFGKYKISKETYTSNFNFYKNDQEDFLKMYEKVVRNLEEMKKLVKPGEKKP